MLKPQDILVLLKLMTVGSEPWTYASLAESLGMSASEVHAAVKRATKAGLYTSSTKRPATGRLVPFLVHGVPHVYLAERGGVTRGIPTGVAAEPLASQFSLDFQRPETIPVWPHAEGDTLGYAISPLYRSAPEAALRDPRLYELLALVDAVREGRARERNMASGELEARLLS